MSGIRYRGKGWPGKFAVAIDEVVQQEKAISYADSWAFLQSYRPLSVHNWPVGTGEHADISCGDAWHKLRHPDEPGSSLILVRTGEGRRIFHAAVAAGYLDVQPATSEMLTQAAKFLLNKKAAIWGRQLAFKLFGIPVTNFTGLPLFSLWLELPTREKARSFFSTLRRIFTKRYWKANEAAQREQIRSVTELDRTRAHNNR